jgi:hypothetical protein
MKSLLGSIVLLLVAQTAAFSQEVGALTIREGGLRVIRGTTILQGAEGMRLRAGDILENSEQGFAQLEFTGGTILAVGPATRLFLLSHSGGRTGAGDKPGAVFVLLKGWIKGESSSDPGTCRYATPLLAVTTRGGTVIVHSTPELSEAFLESGSGTASPVSAEGTLGSAAAAHAGQFFARHPGKNISAGSRPDPDFVHAMPQPFRDTLPSRMSHFVGKPIQPRRDREVSYSDVESWLDIAPAWRHSFVERFRSRLKDPEFRRGVEAHLNVHPEWDPILHPEKYQRSAPPATGGAITPPGGQSK